MPRRLKMDKKSVRRRQLYARKKRAGGRGKGGSVWSKISARLGKERKPLTQYYTSSTGQRVTGSSELGYAIRKGKEAEYWKKKYSVKGRGGAILTPAIMAAARAAKKAGRTSLSQAATRSVKSQIKKVGSGFFDAVRGGFKSGAAPAGIRTAQKAPASYSGPAAAFWKAGHKGAGRKLHMTMGMK